MCVCVCVCVCVCRNDKCRYGPQGWNVQYPFTTGDLNVSALVIANYLDNSDGIPWDDIRYTVSGTSSSTGSAIFGDSFLVIDVSTLRSCSAVGRTSGACSCKSSRRSLMSCTAARQS